MWRREVGRERGRERGREGEVERERRREGVTATSDHASGPNHAPAPHMYRGWIQETTTLQL